VTRPGRGALLAALRLLVVAAAVVVFVFWWQREKAPDFRADRRLLLSPDAAGGPPERVVFGESPRLAWRVPAGRALRFPVTVPGPDAVLRFLEGAREGQPELSVRVVPALGERREAASHESVPSRWTLRRVPLPVTAGQELTLELAVLGLAGEVAIADVVLESAGRGVDETETLITAWAQADELLGRATGERRAMTAAGERARAGLDGPVCMALEPERPVYTVTEPVPAPGRLETVLRVVKPWPEGPSSDGRVLLRLDDKLVGTLPVRLPEGVLAMETLARVDVAAWAGRRVDIGLELEGANNLEVGVRELSLSAPQDVARLPLGPRGGRNVLLIIVDSLRADRLGSYGHPGAATPHLDALAARGGRWTRVLAPSSWTLPNVASLLTGVSPLSHGLGLGRQGVLSSRLHTLAQTAGWSGITTAAFSSSPHVTGHSGLNRGYQTFAFEPLPADVLVEHALDWLVDARQYRWFLTLHLTDATAPYEPTRADRARVPDQPAGALLASLRRLDSRPGAAEAMAQEVGPPYDAEVAGVDRAIGTLLDALDEQGLLDRTLVVVVGAAGEEFYEHNGRQHGQTLYDEVVRVPLIAAGPGIRGSTGGAFVEDEPIELVDVTRLLAYFGQLSSLASLQGRMPPPFAPVLPDPVVHSVLRPYPGVTDRSLDASRSRRYLRILDQRSGVEHLYDLESDPGANRDLLADDPDGSARFQADSLAQAFAEWHRACVAVSAGVPERVPLESP
jgi:arylsulfatase A-like enzyme